MGSPGGPWTSPVQGRCRSLRQSLNVSLNVGKSCFSDPMIAPWTALVGFKGSLSALIGSLERCGGVWCNPGESFWVLVGSQGGSWTFPYRSYTPTYDHIYDHICSYMIIYNHVPSYMITYMIIYDHI